MAKERERRACSEEGDDALFLETLDAFQKNLTVDVTVIDREPFQFLHFDIAAQEVSCKKWRTLAHNGYEEEY